MIMIDVGFRQRPPDGTAPDGGDPAQKSGFAINAGGSLVSSGSGINAGTTSHRSEATQPISPAGTDECVTIVLRQATAGFQGACTLPLPS